LIQKVERTPEPWQNLCAAWPPHLRIPGGSGALRAVEDCPVLLTYPINKRVNVEISEPIEIFRHADTCVPEILPCNK
jgi:hypothetical protein